MLIKQNSSSKNLMFFMADSADHVSGKTGLSPTVTLSKNGGTFAAASGTVTEVGNGWYKVAGNVTDSNTLGDLILHATGAGADATDLYVGNVIAYDPDDPIGYVVSGTVNAVSTVTTIYTALAVLNARTYNNMCLYSESNGERSRILSTGNGFFKVRGFSVAPTNGSNLKIYADGCL